MPPNKTPPPSAEAVNAAWVCMPPEDIRRLMRYAHYRMLGVRELVHDSDAEDLLSEAVIRTMEGKRIWSPCQQSLFNHLVGCMRSIANELSKKGVRFTDLTDGHKSKDDLHAQVDAKANIHRLRMRLHGDTVALRVLETILEDDPPMEAQKTLRIRPNVYAAARKRIFRQAERLFGPTGSKAR